MRQAASDHRQAQLHVKVSRVESFERLTGIASDRGHGDLFKQQRSLFARCFWPRLVLDQSGWVCLPSVSRLRKFPAVATPGFPGLKPFENDNLVLQDRTKGDWANLKFSGWTST